LSSVAPQRVVGSEAHRVGHVRSYHWRTVTRSSSEIVNATRHAHFKQHALACLRVAVEDPPPHTMTMRVRHGGEQFESTDT
jgi:hypothetical protein